MLISSLISANTLSQSPKDFCLNNRTLVYQSHFDKSVCHLQFTSYGNITVHHVTEDGSQIQGIDDETIGLYQNRSGELTGDDIDGYSFLDTKLGNSTNGTSVTSYEVTETYGNVTISFLDEYGDIISTDTYSGTDKHYDVYEIYQAQKIGSISYGTLENGCRRNPELAPLRKAK